MTKFAKGDHVSWNSEAGHVTGHIVAVHVRDYKGHRHHASKESPQYEIKSDRTDHIAAHKESALTRVRDRGSAE
jgi:Hypervirulence associated proteins TUDOR domain